MTRTCCDMDLSCNHFDNYSRNCEFVIINMTMITIRNNYDYIYDYTINVMILKELLDLVQARLKKTKIHINMVKFVLEA